MEIWKKIKPGYEVSSYGRIKSLPKKVSCRKGFRITNEMIMKTKPGSAGYFKVQMGKKCKTLSVHRIVAELFIINPEKNLVLIIKTE